VPIAPAWAKYERPQSTLDITETKQSYGLARSYENQLRYNKKVAEVEIIHSTGVKDRSSSSTSSTALPMLEFFDDSPINPQS